MSTPKMPRVPPDLDLNIPEKAMPEKVRFPINKTLYRLPYRQIQAERYAARIEWFRERGEWEKVHWCMEMRKWHLTKLALERLVE